MKNTAMNVKHLMIFLLSKYLMLNEKNKPLDILNSSLNTLQVLTSSIFRSFILPNIHSFIFFNFNV